jgi:hypothetical protein
LACRIPSCDLNGAPARARAKMTRHETYVPWNMSNNEAVGRCDA